MLLASAASYGALTTLIEAQHPRHDQTRAFRRGVRFAGYATMAVYALAIPSAFVNPVISLVIIFAVNVYYMSPLPRPPHWLAEP